jgi:hypothetical protein
MTRLRKLAIKISDTVIRRCPPAFKDWARATSRELEFIESDWAALRWALGSWRMAASCWNAPLTSMSEVPRAAQHLLRRTRLSAVLTALSLLWISYWFSGIFRPTVAGRQEGLGWCLILAVLGYIAGEAIADRGWRFPREGGSQEVADAYRSALGHQRDLYSGLWYWSRAALFVAGPMMGTYHAWLLKPSAAREAILGANLVACGVLVLSLLVTRPLTRRAVAGYQRTIDELDALEGDGR